MQCLHSHSHTNRTLDSLNNVDRPPPRPHFLVLPCRGSVGMRHVVGVQHSAQGAPFACTGCDVVVVDNLVNSSEEAIRRVKEITGKGDMV